MLASPVFTELYELAGRASLRATAAVSLDVFSRVFWFTLEFGVVHENSAVKAYGAGLLSSYDEKTCATSCSPDGRSAHSSSRTCSRTSVSAGCT